MKIRLTASHNTIARILNIIYLLENKLFGNGSDIGQIEIVPVDKG